MRDKRIARVKPAPTLAVLPAIRGQRHIAEAQLQNRVIRLPDQRADLPEALRIPAPIQQVHNQPVEPNVLIDDTPAHYFFYFLTKPY
jgi:hypothetical protein